MIANRRYGKSKFIVAAIQHYLETDKSILLACVDKEATMRRMKPYFPNAIFKINEMGLLIKKSHLKVVK